MHIFLSFYYKYFIINIITKYIYIYIIFILNSHINFYEQIRKIKLEQKSVLPFKYPIFILNILYLSAYIFKIFEYSLNI